jgi:preprotein translocase subunit SecG
MCPAFDGIRYVFTFRDGDFLTRLTAIFTALFFATSLTLAVFAKKQTADAYSLKSAQTTTSAPVTSPETSSNAPKTTQ